MSGSRKIRTAKNQGGLLSGGQDRDAVSGNLDGYVDIVQKLIPAEIVGVYLCVHSFLVPMDIPQKEGLLWFTFFACLFLTPLYLIRIQKVSLVHSVVSTVGFVPWSLAIGSVFDYYFSNLQVVGGIGLMVYSLVPPLFYIERE